MMTKSSRMQTTWRRSLSNWMDHAHERKLKWFQEKKLDGSSYLRCYMCISWRFLEVLYSYCEWSWRSLNDIFNGISYVLTYSWQCFSFYNNNKKRKLCTNVYVKFLKDNINDGNQNFQTNDKCHRDISRWNKLQILCQLNNHCSKLSSP